MQTNKSYTARHHIWSIHGNENSEYSLVGSVLQQPAGSIYRAEENLNNHLQA
jgi:hypothetical protein